MIFVDSSAFISFFVKNDTYHEKTQKLFEGIIDEDLVTSSEVVTETINWLTRKTSKKIVIEIAEILINEEIVRIINTDIDDMLVAIKQLKKFSDQSISFTDAISFSVIDRLRIKKVLSLDKDFNLIKSIENIFLSTI